MERRFFASGKRRRFFTRDVAIVRAADCASADTGSAESEAFFVGGRYAVGLNVFSKKSINLAQNILTVQTFSVFKY